MSLRITRLEVREVKIPFRFTFKHALAERNVAHNLIVVAHTDTGHAGFGEILPREYLTGETIASAWADLRDRWWPRLRMLEFSETENPVVRLRPVYLEADGARRTGSYAGIDVAVVDAWARSVKKTGATLFGQTPPAEQSLTWPLGGGGVRSVKWSARVGKLFGFRDFKLKTGREDDRERLRCVRRVLGTGRDLRVDANAAFTVEAALARAAMLREFGVSSVEQPIPAGDCAGLARIEREGGIPVMADESLCTLADARALIAAKAASLWNLRLAKVGGFTGFLELLALARAHNIGVHHGVLVGESPVLTAAARACAGLADYTHVEYGFAGVLLKKNIFTGWDRVYSGRGRPLGNAFGLGITPILPVFDSVTVRREIFS